MTRKIRVLPDNLINKIAAGEVVERPASVVKELLENSIDARAKFITIEIEKGGVKLIKVTDDGVGMMPDQAKLALTRHATSKIESVDDLFSISTLGFRGEALPSIASVSMFELVSRTEEFSDGIRIRVEGGNTKSAQPHGCPTGTVIEVRELFFNMPARRKFLKTITTETRQVLQTVTSLGLAHPSLSFKLISEGRTLLDFNPVESLAHRVLDVYGENLFGRFLTFEEDAGQVRVAGFLSPPSDAKRHRMETRFFVNGRPISSRVMHAAVMAAYGELLPKGCYPQGVLFVDVAAEIVDVNVSPTKSEVRFKDERSLYHVLYHTISSAVTAPEIIQEAAGQEGDLSAQDYITRTKSAVESFIRSHEHVSEDTGQTSISLETEPKVDVPRPSPQTDQSYESRPRTTEPSSRSGSGKASTIPRQASSPVKPYHLVGFSDLYVVAFSTDAIFIIDQHAAHERILYEQALAAFDREQLVSQKLLFPVNIELDPAAYHVAEAAMADLNALGFEIRPFGSRSVAVYAVPAVARDANPEKILRHMIDDMGGVDAGSEKIHKKLAQSFACRAALKSGNRLTKEEMAALIADLFRCQNPYVCPHGRPTLIKFSKSELDKRFGR